MHPEGRISLLVAEDDQHIRYLMQVAAERSGCFEAIRAVDNGEAALRAVHEGTAADFPELIVTDLSMPRMGGLELIRALKRDERTRHIPIAVITSSDEPNDREDALAAGAFMFEPKPHGLEALRRLLIQIRQNCVETTMSR